MNWENPNTKIKREETEEGRCYSTRQLFACFLLSRLRHYLRPGTGYPITSTENSVSRTGSCSYDALNRDGSRGKVQGVRTPPRDDLRLNFFFCIKICLRHQSVMTGAAPPKKNHPRWYSGAIKKMGPDYAEAGKHPKNPWSAPAKITLKLCTFSKDSPQQLNWFLKQV